METANIRNLDEIQERESGRSSSRLGSLIVSSIAGACVVFAAMALFRRPPTEKLSRPDPLAALANKTSVAAQASSRVSMGLSGHDVVFPDLLSDGPNPTTAMAAIRAANSPSAPLPSALANAGLTPPPPPSDRLPVVPLPAQNYLALSQVVTEPRDNLTAMANQASTPNSVEVEPGMSGGYQLQVSSFRLEREASRFATALRQRGHRAHVESAIVPSKGTWHRVRVGPFKSKLEAMKYRRDFEAREHMVPFLVEPAEKRAGDQASKKPRRILPD